MKIANAQGFWGDSQLAPKELVKQVKDLDYLTLEYLAEMSLGIMAIQMEKDPNAGYAKDFLQVVEDLKDTKVRIVTNAGGLNPRACGKEVAKILGGKKKIAVITGDEVESTAVCSRAYLGAQPIALALAKGADIVITGRCCDPSLTVGPCVHEFGWGWNEWNKLAGATLAGHLIECGTQVTGGMSTHWLEIENPYQIGYPIAEIHSDGSFVITKPEESGGRVSIETVKEQLLYEIEDPDNYLSPDVILSLLSVKLENVGKDRIKVTGAIGKPPPDTLKVAEIHRSGWKVEGMVSIFGANAVQKAKICADILLERLRKCGFEVDRSCVECIGAGDIVPGVIPRNAEIAECMLRIAIQHQNPEPLFVFAKEIASLVSSGPQGVTGYTHARPKVRPHFTFIPNLITKEKIKPTVEFI
ncbi:MAG: acyclic terpene utilization AtuA family protein [Waddliaceae bacterium]